MERLGLDQLSFSAGAGGAWQLIYRAARRFTVRVQADDDQSVDAIWT